MLVYVCNNVTLRCFFVRSTHDFSFQSPKQFMVRPSDHPMGDVQFLDIPSLVLPLQPDLPSGKHTKSYGKMAIYSGFTH